MTLQVTKTVKMRVRFETMTQMNVGTGWQRNVRCVPSASSTCKVGGAWEYHDGTRDVWTVFPEPVQRHLGACHSCGVDEVKVERAPGQCCKVDLKALRCTDETSGKTDKVRHSELVGMQANDCYKQNNTLPPSYTVWQWKDEHGKWRDYPVSACHNIESVYASFTAGKSTLDTVSLNADGRSYTVDLGAMEQENVASGVRRDVRRLAPAAMSTGEPLSN